MKKEILEKMVAVIKEAQKEKLTKNKIVGKYLFVHNSGVHKQAAVLWGAYLIATISSKGVEFIKNPAYPNALKDLKEAVASMNPKQPKRTRKNNKKSEK